MAAQKMVMLSIETMDDPFLNSLSKVTYLKTQIHSPWLQAYPDVGNLSAWLGNRVGEELERNIDDIVAVHLKDTLPVTNTSPGKFRDLAVGEGSVDFESLLRVFVRLGYSGSYTVEIWAPKSGNPLENIRHAKQYFSQLFDVVGIRQEPITYGRAA